jgi:tubulin polyglutamylase TTLL7
MHIATLPLTKHRAFSFVIDRFMHLTNYSVNKTSEEFNDSESSGEGSKRTVKWMTEFLEEEGHDVTALWSRMSDVILKTLMVSKLATLSALYLACPVLPNREILSSLL